MIGRLSIECFPREMDVSRRARPGKCGNVEGMGCRFFLGVKKAFHHLQIDSEARIGALGGNFEVLAGDEQGNLIGRCFHSMECSVGGNEVHSLTELCSEHVMQTLRIELLPKIFAILTVSLFVPRLFSGL